jgi:hypothetical protein
VLPEIIAKITEEIGASGMEGEVSLPEVLRDLLETLGAQAQRRWQADGLPGLHEAPFLLAFLRQLTAQGWRLAKDTPLSGEEVSPRFVRMLWDRQAPSGASRGRGLDERRSAKSSNAVHFLSSLLARHAQSAWGDAYATYAEIGFPLTRNARGRVGRLRAYGNACCLPQATAFVETVIEALG